MADERELFRGTISGGSSTSSVDASHKEIARRTDPAPWDQWLEKLSKPEPLTEPSFNKHKTRPLQEHLDLNRYLLAAFSFAAGVWAYFLLPEEPFPFVLPVTAICVAIMASVRFWKGQCGLLGSLLAVFFIGAGIANLKTHFIAAPKLSASASFQMTGLIEDVVRNERGVRVLLKIEDLVGPKYALLNGEPEKVRIRLPKGTSVKVGTFISVRGRLFPPAGPVLPGGYDFSFIAYFKQIGGTGYSYGQPNILPPPNEAGVVQSLKSHISNIRASIADRLLSLGRTPETAALMAALLVGNRDYISNESEEVLRISGLAHILAISGLHMALFAGGAYAAFVLCLSVSAKAALTLPIHRLAAAAALLAAIVYLVLSGASVATQRSFVMIALVFLGIIAGRRGLTLRSVAIAGLVLLLIAPEDLFHPGFQMSFAAVLCLVAAYESFRKYSAKNAVLSLKALSYDRWWYKPLVWFLGLVFTSVIAGMATGLVGAHHFGRIAPYGLIGNVLGMPVFSLVVMPMGLLTLILLPFGLASLPIAVMEAGLAVLLDIARYTASLDAGQGIVTPPGALATLLMFSGFFLCLFLYGNYRTLGLAPFLLGAVLWGSSNPADIQLAESGSAIVARDEAGVLRFSSVRAGLRNSMWLQSAGLPEDILKQLKMEPSQRTCDQDGCVIKAFALGDGGAVPLVLAMPKTLDAAMQDCRRADIVVADFDVPETKCTAKVVAGETRVALGAISIWLEEVVGQYSAENHTAIERMENAKTVPARPWHR